MYVRELSHGQDFRAKKRAEKNWDIDAPEPHKLLFVYIHTQKLSDIRLTSSLKIRSLEEEQYHETITRLNEILSQLKLPELDYE